jgi:transposase
MRDGEKLSLEQIRAFLEASEEIQFEGKRRREVYEWITRLLHQQGYRTQGKVVRGLLRRYAAKMTGLGRAQVTRLIGRYMEHSEVKESPRRQHRFPSRFTLADWELLAKVDEAHETMSGPATRKILKREWEIYKHPEYERLATVSVAHIYNLGKRRRYRECRMSYTKLVPCRWRSENGASRSREASLGICVSIRFTREIRTGSRVCTTSTQSMRSLNGKSLARSPRSHKHT